MRKSTNDKRSLIPSIRFDDSAITAIVSLILVITIVSFSISSILFWGIPYINENRVRAEKQASIDNFKVFNGLVNDLIRSGGPGSNITANFNNNIAEGSMEIDSVGDRLIITYSFSEDYIFNVTGLDDNDQWFSIYLEEDSNQELNSVRVYWLNDTCFISGTRVLMGNGSYKCIEDVMVGDFVRSYDENVGCVVSCRVTNVFHHSPEGMGGFYLVLNDGLGVTPNHRFFSNGSWVPIGSLGVGDSLFTSDLDSGYSVFSKRCVFRSVPVFDLSVEGCHNFFVGVEDDVDVLVHNQPDPPTVNPSAPYLAYYNNTEGDYGGDGYSFDAYSASGDGAYYEFSWGDGETTFIPDSALSGVYAYHDWDDVGIYQIKVRANDVLDGTGSWSEWADPYYMFIKENFRKPENYTRIQKIDSYNELGVDPHGYEFQASDNIEGAVCIDLYNDFEGDQYCYPPQINPARGRVPFGRIWLFDLGSIIHYLHSSGVNFHINILENDAVIISSGSSSTLELGPIFQGGKEVFELNIITIRGKTDMLYGSGEGIYEFSLHVENSYVREPLILNSEIHDLKLQLFGDYADAWISYYLSTGVFYKLSGSHSPNTVRLKGGDKMIILTSSMIRVSLEGIR